MGKFFCPRCLACLDEAPDIGKDCDCKKRQNLRDHAKDSTCVEDAWRIIFDHGMSVGGQLEILKEGSLVPTRVTPSFSLPYFLFNSCTPERLLHRAWCQPGEAYAG